MLSFAGKQGLILGIANDYSIAWAITQEVLAGGGTCGFSHLPDRPDDERQRNRRRVAQLVEGQPGTKFLVPLDVSQDASIEALVATTREQFGKIDFLLHSIAFANLEDLKRETVATSRDGFKLAMEISAYSLLALCNAFKDVFNPGASVLTMTYFGGEKIVPGYNVMGICKAALDACVKYAAYDLGPQGVRVNAVSAGPIRTLAGKGAGVDDMLPLYEKMAPLQRNVSHQEVGRSGAYLLSDYSSGITAEILHVDSGYNAMGSPGRLLDDLRQHISKG